MAVPSSDLTLCWCSLWTKTQLEYIIIIIGKLSRNGLFSTAMWHDRTVKRSDFCKEEKCSQREWRFITIICCCAGMSVWKLDDTVKSKKFLNCLLNGHLKMVFCHLKRHPEKTVGWNGFPNFEISQVWGDTKNQCTLSIWKPWWS